MKKKHVLISLLFISSISFAQDIHFTQWSAIGNFSNPSFTGNHNQDYSIAIQYRNQWKAIGKPFATSMFYFDNSIYWKKIRITPAIKFYNDVASQNLTSNAIYVPVAAALKFNGYEIFTGVELGYAFKSLNYSSETFPNQFDWNSGQFDSNLQNKENLQKSNSYVDLNLGFGAKKNVRKNTYCLGVSLHHLTSPNESFSNFDSRLKRRISLQFLYSRIISDKLSVDVNALIMAQNKANENLIGINANYGITSKTTLFVGVNDRYGIKNNNDAISLIVGLSEKKYRVGLSYDVTTSKLINENNGRGAFEFFVSYYGLNTKPKKIKIECERL